MDSRPVFYIIDGHAVAYRQFFALNAPSFVTRSGVPTNATFGFARSLLDILQKETPHYIAVSFDRGLSGRDELYGEYKGTREKMPDPLREQLDWIEKLVAAFNMPILAQEGYEADDVIGTIAQQAVAKDVDVRVITGDRDLLQLMTDHITVQLPDRSKTGGGQDVVWDVAKFHAEYAFEPWQLVEYKALVGDTSDNIPGVAGIGKTTAPGLIQSYQTIEGIYEHLSELKPALQKKLIEGRDSAFLSKNLATIRRNVPITLDLEACVAHDYSVRTVDTLFGELEFRSLRDRLPKMKEQLSLFDMGTVSDLPAETEEEKERPPVCETIIVNTADGLKALVDTLNQPEGISWDVETTSTDQMSAELVGISLAVNGEIGYYVPVGHKAGEQLPLQTVLDALRPPLTNPKIPKFAHNANYDLVVLQRYGIDVAPVAFDTMIAEFLRHPDGKTAGLKNLARQELDIHMTEITELIGKGTKQVTMDTVSVERAAPYAAADAVVTRRLVTYLQPKIEELEMHNLYYDVEIPLIPVIASMERNGVALDTAYLADLSEKLDKIQTDLEQRIYSESGYGQFNLNSPKQLNDVLFGKLGLSTEGLRKTTHGFSTDAAVLEGLKGEHPVIDRILEYREVAKLKGTYVDALPLLINPHTGRVHTLYSQIGAASGRLSSSNPNLQNIPIRTELGREVRRAFVSPAGMKLLSVDYSQVELRILAHVSQDKTLLEAFGQGLDIHAATAAAIYSIPLESVNKEQRTFAKRINFGLIYGMGAFRLARDSELTLSEAKKFIETYFARLPGVERYMDETKQRARQGAIETLFGRKREFAGLINGRGNKVEQQAEERIAINMPIQGTAADIMKKAMVNLYNELQRSHLNARMILQVHDELVLEVPEAEVSETCDLVVRTMEGAYLLDAPLKANANVGDNWRDMDGLETSF